MNRTIDFDIGQHTDKGIRRQDNQDRMGRADKWLDKEQHELRQRYGRLYVVADGVGGNQNGEKAARMTVEGVLQRYYDEQDSANPADLHERLRYAIERTSEKIYYAAEDDCTNMASTIVAALVYQDRLIVANVGDSRALLIRGRDKSVVQVSTDHATPGRKGMLTQSMGDIEVEVTIREEPFTPGNIVVLCTDGLTDLVTPDEIQDIVSRNNAGSASKELVALANRKGGHDNITALVVRHGKIPLLRQASVKRILALIAAVLCIGIFLLWFTSNIVADNGGLPGINNTSVVDFTKTASTPHIGPTSELLPTPSPSPTFTPVPVTPTPIRTLVPRPGSPIVVPNVPAPATSTPVPDLNEPTPEYTLVIPTSEPVVNVPNVVGSYALAAQATLQNSGFQSSLVDYSGTNCTQYTVVDMQPPANTPQPAGSIVTLFVCPGIKVPNVIGKHKDIAYTTLLNAGLSPVFNKTPDGSKDPDIVWATAPGPGEMVNPGSTITVSYYIGTGDGGGGGDDDEGGDGKNSNKPGN